MIDKISLSLSLSLPLSPSLSHSRTGLRGVEVSHEVFLGRGKRPPNIANSRHALPARQRHLCVRVCVCVCVCVRVCVCARARKRPPNIANSRHAQRGRERESSIAGTAHRGGCCRRSERRGGRVDRQAAVAQRRTHRGADGRTDARTHNTATHHHHLHHHNHDHHHHDHHHHHHHQTHNRLCKAVSAACTAARSRKCRRMHASARPRTSAHANSPLLHLLLLPPSRSPPPGGMAACP